MNNVGRKTKRPRAEVVGGFLWAMQLHFHGDLRWQGKQRVKALQRLLTLRKLGSISPGEPSAREQLKKLVIDAVDRNDGKFFDDLAKALKEKGVKDVLKDYAYIVAEELIREHEPNGTLPFKRDIRLATLKMRERIKLILDDRDFSFRKLPEGERRKKIEWELMCQDENSKFWTRFWKEAHLTDLPENPGGQPSHHSSSTVDKS
jgi:hypothetical protein